MTDGIIQKVLKKHKIDSFSYITVVINEIEQELIEEIRKEFQGKYEDDYEIGYTYAREILIGDSKE